MPSTAAASASNPAFFALWTPSLATFSAQLAESLHTEALAFGAGAMLYVVIDELIPESHGHGPKRAASLALLGSFALMMALDNAFG